MKRACMLAVLALVAALVAVPASAAPTKWVRGPVTALAGDTITVTVKGVESVFKVENTTQLIARGAGTAQKTGKGPKLGDFVKVGQFVEVRYTETGGAKMATEIRPLATEEEGASKEKDAAVVVTGASVHGPIVSVAMDSIVIKADGADMKFTVTPNTKVLGPGMGTKASELKAAGKPTTVPALLGPKDQVVVYYTEGGAAPEATSIRVVVKVAK
jgi:hypothetical protein